MCKAVLVCAALLLPLNLFGDDPDPDHKPDPELELELSLPKKEIVQFEPLVITISVENQSEQPRKISRAFDPCWHYLKVFVTDPAGRVHHLGGGVICCGFGGTLTLPPKGRNNAIHLRMLLTPSPNTWLDTPGKYQLNATFQAGDNNGPLVAQTATLTIKPAEGVDKKALKLFRGEDQAEFLANQTTSPKIGKHFETLIQDYPKSVYVPWCYYVLGRAAQRQDHILYEDRGEAVRKYYKHLLETDSKFPLKTEVEYEMARELIRMEKPDAAKRAIEKLIQNNSELYLFRRVTESMDYLRKENRRLFAESLPDSIDIHWKLSR